MLCLRCGQCCKETEMLLSNDDVLRLKRAGYDEGFFSKVDTEGYITLRNVNGCCVFFDVENRSCSIRSFRPAGCRLYPVILDEDKGIVLDDICPAGKTETEKQKAKRGKQIRRLLERIDAEAEERRLV
jgi:Fe-S-cluster containining protein